MQGRAVCNANQHHSTTLEALITFLFERRNHASDGCGREAKIRGAYAWRVIVVRIPIPACAYVGTIPSNNVRSYSHACLPISAMSVTNCLSSANDLLAAHASLVSRVRTSQKYHRRQLAALSSPPQSLLKLDLLPSPPPSPSLSPPGSPVLQPKQKVVRTDLPPAKKARVAKYQNYVPEEETIRNDYNQRYVDGGEWSQNWVLGADPARRFEE